MAIKGRIPNQFYLLILQETMPIRPPIILTLLPTPTCSPMPFIPNIPSTIFKEEEQIMLQELPVPPYHDYTASTT
jgi:hypothetical protein